MYDDRASSGAAGPPNPAADPIIAAARQMVVDIFRTSAAQLPDLLKAQALPSNEIPAFTAEIISRMEVQLARALGQPTDQPGRRHERG